MTLARRAPAAAALALAALALPLAARDVPFASGYVNDEARVLSDGERIRLEALLRAQEAKTSNQVVVLTVASLEGESLEEFSLKVARSWKVGQQGKKNGVLLLVARDDRKLRIEVGYGLEGALPDVVCGRIIRDEIVPKLKSGDYDGGVAAGVNAILSAIQGTYAPSKGDRLASGVAAGSSSMPLGGRIVMGAVFLVVVGLFTAIALFIPGCVGWGLYAFLVPFWASFPLAILGFPWGLIALGVYLVGFPIARVRLAPMTPSLFRTLGNVGGGMARGSGWSAAGGWSGGSSGWSGSSGSSGSSFSSGSSSDSSGFSGGGGDFGGGGASDGW